MSSIRYLYLNDKDLDLREREWRNMFFTELEEDHLKRAKERIEAILEEDFQEAIGAERYERTPRRRGYRGGYRYRDLMIWGGNVRKIKVPKGEKGYRFWLLEPHKRRIEKLSNAMYRAFIYGMSDRKVSEYFKGLYGEGVLTAQGVSYLYKKMSEDVEAWHRRETGDNYKYIYLDAMVQSVRGAIRRQRTILVAYGVRYDGKKEVIDYRVETGESASAWSRFLQSLYERGLKGKMLQLIIHDGCGGLIDALRWLWPDVKTQLCYIHRMRNLSKRLKNRHIRSKIMREVSRIYRAESRQEAYWRIRALESKWSYWEPNAIRLFLKNIENSLTYFDFPREDWDMLKSTNPLERQLEELRRRMIPMRCFSNPVSCDRIVYGLVQELYQKEDAQIQKSEFVLT